MRQVKTRVMEHRPAPSITATVEAAFAWWREAGVDHDFHDEPEDWLAPPPAEEGEVEPDLPPPPPPEIARALAPREAPPLDLEGMPAELDAWREWWLSAPALDGGRTNGRVPPRGIAGAKLMIVVPQPEAGDSDSLLSGPQGRLLGAMLRAMGLASEDVYLASALPRHTPLADWEGLAAGGLGTALARHVSLAAPQRLLAFGNTILPLLGNDPPLSAHPSRQFNHEGRSIPLLVARDLESLERWTWKARFWRDWLAWVDAGSTHAG